MEHPVIRLYFCLIALKASGMGIIAAMYSTFLLDKGLNLFEINLVNVVFFATMFLCEVPTGAVADVFGRKVSFVASCAIFAISMFVYGLSSTFWGFILAEALGALAHTLTSGAFDAWLVDKLRHHRHTVALNTVFVRATQIGLGTGLVAALLGAYLYEKSGGLPWMVGGLLFAIAGILAAVSMKEEYFVRQKFSVRNGLRELRHTTETALAYSLKDKRVRFVMLLSVSLSFAAMAPNMQWQPLFKEWLPTQTAMGGLWILMSFALMLGTSFAPRLLRSTSERRALLIGHAVIGLGILGTVSFSALPPVLLMFLLHEAARGLAAPIKNAYLHDNIPSKERATIVSFESISHHIGGAVGLVVSGYLAQYGGMPLAWIFSSLILFVSVTLLWKNGT